MNGSKINDRLNIMSKVEKLFSIVNGQKKIFNRMSKIYFKSKNY